MIAKCETLARLEKDIATACAKFDAIATALTFVSGSRQLPPGIVDAMVNAAEEIAGVSDFLARRAAKRLQKRKTK